MKLMNRKRTYFSIQQLWIRKTLGQYYLVDLICQCCFERRRHPQAPDFSLIVLGYVLSSPDVVQKDFAVPKKRLFIGSMSHSKSM